MQKNDQRAVKNSKLKCVHFSSGARERQPGDKDLEGPRSRRNKRTVKVQLLRNFSNSGSYQFVKVKECWLV